MTTFILMSTSSTWSYVFMYDHLITVFLQSMNEWMNDGVHNRVHTNCERHSLTYPHWTAVFLIQFLYLFHQHLYLPTPDHSTISGYIFYVHTHTHFECRTTLDYLESGARLARFFYTTRRRWHIPVENIDDWLDGVDAEIAMSNTAASHFLARIYIYICTRANE